VCNQITDDATCDASTGEWVIPTDLNINSATIACPVRIQGDFGVGGALRIGGCARINVVGRTTFRSPNGNGIDSWIPVTFDLNDFGRPRAGNRIRWLNSNAGITGNIAGGGFENIWDLTGAVDVANQLCGNEMTLQFFVAGQTAPARNCNPALELQELQAAFNAAQLPSQAEAGEDGVFGEIVEDNFDAAIAGNFDDAIEFNDAAVAGDSATNSQTTPQTSANNGAAPGYAYGLFAVAVVILIALVVVQILLVLLSRAKESPRH